MKFGCGKGGIYLAIVLPLQDTGAFCEHGLYASAGFIGRRPSLYIMCNREKRPSPKKRFLEMVSRDLSREAISLLKLVSLSCTSRTYQHHQGKSLCRKIGRDCMLTETDHLFIYFSSASQHLQVSLVIIIVPDLFSTSKAIYTSKTGIWTIFGR